MSTVTASASYGRAAGLGAAAGTLASLVQVVVGWLIDRLFLPRGHDNNISPRFINRSARKTGHRTHPLHDWVLGTLFHFGYAIGLGLVYGLVRRWSGLPGLFLGGVLSWMIYLLAFSRVGAGTKTGTEQHPERRPWSKQLSLIAVAATYAFSTAIIFSRLERRP